MKYLFFSCSQNLGFRKFSIFSPFWLRILLVPEGCCTKKRFVRMKGAERGRFFPLFSGLRMWSKMLKRIISFARSFPSERYLASSAYGRRDGNESGPRREGGKKYFIPLWIVHFWWGSSRCFIYFGVRSSLSQLLDLYLWFRAKLRIYFVSVESTQYHPTVTDIIAQPKFLMKLLRLFTGIEMKKSTSCLCQVEIHLISWESRPQKTNIIQTLQTENFSTLGKSS